MKARLILMLAGVLFAMPASADVTDVIKQYAINVQPQPDGMLRLEYRIHWCVVSNAAGNLTYFEVGLPNRSFTIESFGGEHVRELQPANKGSWSGVRADMRRPFRAGDCFTASFIVRQGRMAHINDKQEVSFQYIPGWFDEVPIERLSIRWELPQNASWLKLAEPEPRREGNAAIWEKASLEPGEKYPVKLLYAKEAFPNMTPESAGVSDDVSISGGVLLAVVIVIVIVVVILFIALVALSDDYGGGGYIGGGGGSGGGGYIGGGGGGYRGGGLGRSSGSRSGGGGGSFGGRGSSCACVSCACACACAGGGRAGCSQKGFYIPTSFKRREGGGEASENHP